MNGNRLIFSRSGDRRRLYPVDPLLFPQYETYNKYFLPEQHELPSHGLTTRMIVFDFGFGDPSLTIAPYDTQFFQLVLGKDFLGLAMNGVSDVLGLPNVPAAGSLAGVQQAPSYLINIQHTHEGNTRQWFSKNVTNIEAVGSGEQPKIFKEPVLVPKGDTITCVIQNMVNASMRVQLLLLGGEF